MNERKIIERPNLKTIFALRHGLNSGSNQLSLEGREQIMKLAKRLRELISIGLKVDILTSPTGRARESADIIRAEFGGIEYRTVGSLELDDFDCGDMQRDDILYMAEDSSVAIAITHHESPSGIAHAFRMARFGKPVTMFECPKGDGVMVSLETGDVVTSILNHRPQLA